VRARPVSVFFFLKKAICPSSYKIALARLPRLRESNGGQVAGRLARRADGFAALKKGNS
jgi:hypothetical protein